MLRLIKQLTVLIVGILLSVHALAASSQGGEGKKNRPPQSEPVHILSDSLKVFQKQHYALFSGNVRATQADLHISCATLTVRYFAGKTGKSMGKVLSMLFAGDVIITQGERKGHCEQAQYLKTESRLVCTGDPWVIDGDSKIHGDEIIYLLDKDEVRVKRPRVLIDVSDKTKQDDS